MFRRASGDEILRVVDPFALEGVQYNRCPWQGRKPQPGLAGWDWCNSCLVLQLPYGRCGLQ